MTAIELAGNLGVLAGKLRHHPGWTVGFNRNGDIILYDDRGRRAAWLNIEYCASEIFPRAWRD